MFDPYVSHTILFCTVRTVRPFQKRKKPLVVVVPTILQKEDSTRMLVFFIRGFGTNRNDHKLLVYESYLRKRRRSN